MHLHTLRKSLFGKGPLGNALFGKAALATAALGGFFFLASAPGAQAAGPDNCQRRIAKTEHELGEAIEDHGYNSRQANHWRHERREAYERCYGDGYYRGQNGYARDDNGYYRDERGNYYYFRYDRDNDRRHRDYDRDRRRTRDWDDD